MPKKKSDDKPRKSPVSAEPPKAGIEGKPFSRTSGSDLPPPSTPLPSRRDPSVPAPATSTSKSPTFDPEHTENPTVPWHKRCRNFMYDKQQGTFCDRTCTSWAKILAYAIMYLIFLSTYTLMFLYFSLLVIKSSSFKNSDEMMETSQLIYSSENIGLSGVPLEEHNYPLIWYRTGEANDYSKYVSALDKLLEKSRSKRDLGFNLGPCGQSPYGYGEKPCIIVRINKHLKWAGKPLQPGSPKAKKAPEEVQKWIQRDSKKYWLHCMGFHNYDKEHIGRIQYYPDPPGFDSSLFPLDMKSKSPLVAFQVSNFTMGISLTIECKLWFETGSSSVAFMLYVSPKSKYLRNASRW